MSARRTIALAALAFVVAGCQAPASPRAQALVYLDTDAPVPRMMNRLRLEVLGPDLRPLCPGCARSFGLDDKTAWPVSFGVAAADDGSPRYLRATLFPVGRTVLGEPDPPTAIDLIAALGFSGVDAQYLFLPLDCAGIPASTGERTSCLSSDDRQAPIAPAPPWQGEPSRVGTWRAEYVRSCKGAPRPGSDRLRDGEACVNGGTFWMGDYRLHGFGISDGVPEHAVALSPFFIDRFEFTIGRFRAALAAGYRPLGAIETTDYNDDFLKHCDYLPGSGDPMIDQLPLNCLGADEADAICHADGGRRLATEAEWEWAAGSAAQERLFPWGDDPRSPGDQHTGPIEVDMHADDHTADGIADMASNVMEFVSDGFALYTGGCWAPGSYGPDPLCPAASTDNPSVRVIRGGYNGANSGLMTAVGRFGADGASFDYNVGFRCVREDR